MTSSTVCPAARSRCATSSDWATASALGRVPRRSATGRGGSGHRRSPGGTRPGDSRFSGCAEGPGSSPRPWRAPLHRRFERREDVAVALQRDGGGGLRVELEQLAQGVRVAAAVRALGQPLDLHGRGVQELVDDAADAADELVAHPGVQAGQPRVEPQQLGVDHLRRAAAQRRDRRGDLGGALGGEVGLRLLGDQLLRRRDGRTARAGGQPAPAA